MKKRLEDMSLEELWELFPIVLSPHDSRWRDWAHEEIKLLSILLADHKPIINHIGSTAIPDIHAKPIVDILVEVPQEVAWSAVKETMLLNGYICMAESDNRLSFNKGYTSDGYADKVFHIHFHRVGDNDEILFRDYLIAHPDEAREYEWLKKGLAVKFRNDRDGYTEAKSQFVERIINAAHSGFFSVYTLK